MLDRRFFSSLLLDVAKEAYSFNLHIVIRRTSAQGDHSVETESSWVLYDTIEVLNHHNTKPAVLLVFLVCERINVFVV